MSVHWASFVIVLGMTIGGGTANGLLSDRIVQIALLPLVVLAAFRMGRARLPAHGAIWLIAFFTLLVWQLVPIGWGGTPRLFSASPGKALDYAVFALSLSGFAVFVTTLDDAGQRRLLWFFVLGYVMNLTVAAVQLSFVGASGPFASPFYRLAQGAFANQNHFSSLVYALMPAFALMLVHERRQVPLYVMAVLAAIVVLLAANARAAVAIALVLSIVSLFVFLGDRPTLKRRRIAWTLTGSAATFVVAASAIAHYAGAFQHDLRPRFFANTWIAIGDHWPLGSGLGSFRDVYPRYEPLTGVETTYANHAHNDFLELTLELGLPGVILIVGLIAIIAAHLLRTPRTLACGLGAFAIVAHSVVDYPMRTYAIGLLFAYFCAVCLSDARMRPDVRPVDTTLSY